MLALILAVCCADPVSPTQLRARAIIAVSASLPVKRAAKTSCRCGDACPRGGGCDACACATSTTAAPSPISYPVIHAAVLHAQATPPQMLYSASAPLPYTAAPVLRAAPSYSFAPAVGASSCPGGNCRR